MLTCGNISGLVSKTDKIIKDLFHLVNTTQNFRCKHNMLLRKKKKNTLIFQMFNCFILGNVVDLVSLKGYLKKKRFLFFSFYFHFRCYVLSLACTPRVQVSRVVHSNRIRIAFGSEKNRILFFLSFWLIERPVPRIRQRTKGRNIASCNGVIWFRR